MLTAYTFAAWLLGPAPANAAIGVLASTTAGGQGAEATDRLTSAVTQIGEAAGLLIVLLGAAYGSIKLWGAKFSRTEQTVRTKVGDDDVLEVTTKTAHKDDLIASTSGMQVIQSHYEHIIKEQNKVISGYRDDREQDRERITRVETKLENLQETIGLKEQTIKIREEEIDEYRKRIKLYQDDREHNLERIATLERQVERLTMEIAAIKESK